MTSWVTPTVWPSAPTPIMPKHLNNISQNLTHIKEQTDDLFLTLSTFTGAPVIRSATRIDATVWQTGEIYNAGRIVVYYNGMLARKGTDWNESAGIANGPITFTFNTTTSDTVSVHDWTP